jgi:hypothetical protein
VVEFYQQPRNIVLRESLQGLLDDSAPIHLERQLKHLTFQSVSNIRLYLRRPEVEQLLDHVVAEHVVPEPSHRRESFLSDDELLRGIAHF